jgi:hypothetical protein
MDVPRIATRLSVATSGDCDCVREFDYLLAAPPSQDFPMHLGFEELDELAFAAAAGGNLHARPTRWTAKNLGTVIELQWLATAGIRVPSLNDLVASRRVQLVRSIGEGRNTAVFEREKCRSRLIRCYWAEDEEPDEWYEFCRSLQAAAIVAGFPTKNAQELVAATRELVSNVFEHSAAPTTGIVGFATLSNELEIVVADQGIGVLQSLRSSPEFSALRDSGEALQAALTDGTSRFGRSSGHGGGFRNLFRGLLNLSSSLRFRSGDHALSINGTNPQLEIARIGQKVKLPGFIVCIVCRR